MIVSDRIPTGQGIVSWAKLWSPQQEPDKLLHFMADRFLWQIVKAARLGAASHYHCGLFLPHRSLNLSRKFVRHHRHSGSCRIRSAQQLPSPA